MLNFKNNAVMIKWFDECLVQNNFTQAKQFLKNKRNQLNYREYEAILLKLIERRVSDLLEYFLSENTNNPISNKTEKSYLEKAYHQAKKNDDIESIKKLILYKKKYIKECVVEHFNEIAKAKKANEIEKLIKYSKNIISIENLIDSLEGLNGKAKQHIYNAINNRILKTRCFFVTPVLSNEKALALSNDNKLSVDCRFRILVRNLGYTKVEDIKKFYDKFKKQIDNQNFLDSIQFVIEHCKPQMADAFISKIGINKESVLDCFIARGQLEAVKKLYQPGKIEKAITAAQSDIIRYMLKRGENPQQAISQAKWDSILLKEDAVLNKKYIEWLKNKPQTALLKKIREMQSKKTALLSGEIISKVKNALLKNNLRKFNKDKNVKYSVIKAKNNQLYIIFNSNNAKGSRNYLGRGVDGKVKFAYDVSSKDWVAVKTTRDKEAYQKELSALKKIKMCKAELIDPSREKHYIVMDYIPGISLFHFFKLCKKHNQYLVERHQLELFYNFLTEYQTKILNNKLLHDDLHTCNLLVDVSNRRVTIIDFSRSKTNHHLNDGFQLDINEVLKYFKNECDSIIVQQEISKLQAKQGPLFNNRLKQSISILDQALKESRTCPVTTNQPLFTPRYHFRARLSENTSVAPSFSQKARLV